MHLLMRMGSFWLWVGVAALAPVWGQEQQCEGAPNTAKWAQVDLPAPPYPQPRAFHTVVLLDQWSFLMFGGRSDTTVYGDLWRSCVLPEVCSDPRPWLPLVPSTLLYAVPDGRFAHSAAVLTAGGHNVMAVFGGLVTADFTVTNELWLYDVDGANWTRVVPGSEEHWPSPRYGHIAVVNNNLLYVTGGLSTTRLVGNNTALPLDEMYVLVPSESLQGNSWQWSRVELTAPPAPRAFAAATLWYAGVLLVLGGWSGAANELALRDMHAVVLAPTTQAAWHKIEWDGAALPAFSQMFLLEDKLLVWGGTLYPQASIVLWDYERAHGTFPPYIQSDNNLYRLELDTNVTTATLLNNVSAVDESAPSPREGHTMTPYGGQFAYTFGGYTSFGDYYFNDAWNSIGVLQSTRNMDIQGWRKQLVSSSAPESVSGATLVAGPDDRLWLFGGYGDTYTANANLWAYSNSSGWVDFTAHLPETVMLARAYHTAVMLNGGQMVVYGGAHAQPPGTTYQLSQFFFFNTSGLNAVSFDVSGSSTTPIPRIGHTAIAFGDAMLIAGGLSSPNCTGMIDERPPSFLLDDVWSWNATIAQLGAGLSTAWTPLPSLPKKLFGMGGALFFSGTSYYLMIYGGSTNATDFLGDFFQNQLLGLSLGSSERILQPGTMWAVWDPVPDLVRPNPLMYCSLLSRWPYTSLILVGGQVANATELIMQTSDVWIYSQSSSTSGEPLSWQYHRAHGTAVTTRTPAYALGYSIGLPMYVFPGSLASNKVQYALNEITLVCQAGYAGQDVTECVECAVGNFSISGDTKTCQMCPAGTTTRSAGSNSITNCTVCQPGSCSNRGSCTVALDFVVVCHCDFGYRGPNCDDNFIIIVLASCLPTLALVVMGCFIGQRVRRRLKVLHFDHELNQLLLQDTRMQLEDLERIWKIDAADLDISDLIGEGAFGVVHKARWRSMDVALKFMRPGIESVDILTAEFDHEVKVLRALRHRNIVFFYGAGSTASGQPFLVMELCLRGSLYDVLHSNAELPVAEALTIAWDTANGLKFLHGLSPPHLQ